MAILSPFGPFRALDNNGDPLNGGKLYTYEAGTSTPKSTYTDAGGLTANANPVVLNSAGYANIWLGDGGYKFILKTSADATLWTIDDIGGDSTNAFGGAFTDNSGSLSVSTVYQNGVIRQTGAGTLSLLPAATAGSGFYFIVRKDTASTVTIDPNLSETINGASTLSLVSDAVIICNGTAWYTLFMDIVTLAGTNAFTGTNTFAGTSTFSGSVALNGTTTMVGIVAIAGNASTQAKISLAEDTDNGTNKVTIQPPAALAADYTLTLPVDDGTPNQYLKTDGSGVTSWASPVIVDRAYTEYLTSADITTVIPFDDTIPQVGEGTQILSVSITPKTTTNRIRLRFTGTGNISSNDVIIFAMFANGAADAIAAGATFSQATGNLVNCILETELVPGSTSAQTYTLRVGPSSALTLRMNGTSAARRFGGVAKCVLIAEEITA